MSNLYVVTTGYIWPKLKEKQWLDSISEQQFLV